MVKFAPVLGLLVGLLSCAAGAASIAAAEVDLNDSTQQETPPASGSCSGYQGLENRPKILNRAKAVLWRLGKAFPAKVADGLR